MSIKKFIEYIITIDNVDDILNSCNTQSEKGFIFERLFDIVIKFGFCDVFPNSKFNHLTGNFNDAKLKILKNLEKYLNEKVISGNSSGCSDISLQNKEDDTFIFISCKYPKINENIKKQKSVNYYDIQNIIANARKNEHIYKNYIIYILVPNKIMLLNKVNKTKKTSIYITEHMTESKILDKNDLNKYFLKFKQDIIKNKKKNWQTFYLTDKENLNLRFHQELITQKTSDLIKLGHKTFLWGCKCRSGKTYMIGGIIIKQLDIKKKLNVLIITPSPTETIEQFTDGLFRKFKNFNEFKIHHIEGSNIICDIVPKKNNIFIISKQLLQKYIYEKTISLIKNLNLDIIGFDENHFSGTTDLAKDIINSYSNNDTVKIYLTATYNKPLKEWNILPECQMYWDIEDEQICKSIVSDHKNIDKLKEKHGIVNVSETINNYFNIGLSYDDIFSCYIKMPDLYLITNMFDSHRYDIIKEKLNSQNKMGFCFDTLFGLNKLKTKFCFENEVKIILRYISGSQKEEDGEKTIFPRINYICSEKDTRIPFTQIWFIPSENVNKISICLKKLMSEDIILKNYDVLCINRKNKEIAKDIKDEINKRECEAKSKGKLGLIILAGNMLTLGITLDLCDVVILMNNTLSSDKVLQQMYRCMTEGNNKKIGFVIDLNISRVLNTCINYAVHKKENNIENKIKYLINNHLINIDVDMMDNKKINSDFIIKKMMDIWKEDPINSFKILLNKLDDDYDNFNNETQKIINKTFTKNLKDKIKANIIMKDNIEDLQLLPTGREKIQDNGADTDLIDNKIIKEGKEEKEEIQISFTKDVLPYIIPLACILTVTNSNTDFLNMLIDIKNNPSLLDIFNDQCLIWWNNKCLIDLIKEIVSKYFNKETIAYNITIQFKMSLQSLIDNPKELLELINDCLKPKEVEKKEYGEVFTPIKLINEMLDKLPLEVWKNKNLKWLDPCCGMGNFPVAIYLRLMEGLKDQIKDDMHRKKHILENMLYMSELNKKNIFICRQIFDINNDYKLNIYCGDSLNVNYNKIFKIKHFDIVVGNPPYNAAGSKASGNTIWQLFVDMSIELLKNGGYMCFVHPNGWRKPNTDKGKFSGLFKKLTSDNTILYLEIHDAKDGSKNFNCGTRYDWYILQKKKNNDHITIILDQCNILHEINLKKYSWLANCELGIIEKILANENEEKCQILQSMSAYEPRKKWISKEESKIYKYPVVHSTPKNGPRFVWSSRNDKGFYGIKKIIFGESGIYNPIIDIDGKYGMSQGAMAIIINDIEEGNKISNFLTSNTFKKISNACLWSSFRIEWCMFKDFKKNFYEILDN